MDAALEFVGEAERCGGFESESRIVGGVAEDDGPAVIGSLAGEQTGADEVGADSVTAMFFEDGQGTQAETGLAVPGRYGAKGYVAHDAVIEYCHERNRQTAGGTECVDEPGFAVGREAARLTAWIAETSEASSVRTMQVMTRSHLSLALSIEERGPERDCKELRLRDCGFGFFDDRGERGRVENCQLGQALAIEFDAGLGAAVDELAVAEAVLAAGRVDADDPQLAEFTLAYAAIAEGEGFGAGEILFGGADQMAPSADVTLRLLEETILSAFAGDRICGSH